MVFNTRINPLLFTLLFLVGIPAASFGQHKKIDRLEQYYDQQHYKSVHRKAGKLMRDPLYSDFVLPKYYSAMSSFQLMQNPYWMKRNLVKIDESCRLMNAVFQSEQWSVMMESHAKELGDMAVLFDQWLKEKNNVVEQDNRKQVEDWIQNVYKNYKFKNPVLEDVGPEGLVFEGMDVSERSRLIHYSYEFIGIPYKWGRVDSEGFDCSGFTKHVFKHLDLNIPRVAGDQYKNAKTIQAKRAYMGDLVFFSEGKEITHVGILVNQPHENKRMIHSSTSKGISVVDIEASSYWKNRLVGYGRIIR